MCTKTFLLTDPIILLFNEVEELQEMATAAQAPLTNQQIMNLGLKLIKNTADFEKALANWYATPTNCQTWVNFKTHFTATQEQL